MNKKKLHNIFEKKLKLVRILIREDDLQKIMNENPELSLEKDCLYWEDCKNE